MEVIRKITVNKKEREVLDEFFEICDSYLSLNYEDIGYLLESIYKNDKDFEVGDELYDIEYTDQGLYSP